MEVHAKASFMKIFFDLDGTLIDSRKRMYNLFQHLVSESKLTYEDYWELKRNKIDHQEILLTKFLYSEVEYENFVKNWMDKIELPEWLALDQPFPGVTKYLFALSQRHSLYIITARQSTDRALKQVENYGWTGFFENVFVTNLQKEKFEVLKNVIIEQTDWLIGDTGNDIMTGKKLGMKTAAVLSGFLCKEKLVEYQPDMIINGVKDFIV